MLHRENNKTNKQINKLRHETLVVFLWSVKRLGSELSLCSYKQVTTTSLGTSLPIDS